MGVKSIPGLDIVFALHRHVSPTFTGVALFKMEDTGTTNLVPPAFSRVDYLYITTEPWQSSLLRLGYARGATDASVSDSMSSH